MTETRRWLELRRRELARWTVGAGLMLTVGLVAGLLALGVGLGRLGIYRSLPATVLLAWIGAILAVVWGATWYRRRSRGLAVLSLARTLERHGAKRRGSVSGVAAWEPEAGSASLAAVADQSVARWLSTDGDLALSNVRRAAVKSAGAGSAVLAVGVLALALSGPGAPGGTAFLQPISLLLPGRGPVELEVDRTEVRRGDSVQVTVTAVGRRSVSLWVRAPGEPWNIQPLAVDTIGSAVFMIGPLESDRYLRAQAARHSSETVHIRVALPAFIADLQLLARYPAYLETADELLASGEDLLPLPIGTRIVTQGRASVPLERVAWEAPDRHVELKSKGKTFRGTLAVRESARWELAAVAAAGGSLDESPPVLNILAVPDSAPVVAVPVPGADTTVPLSLKQAIVIDARDDHRLSEVELVSWRVSRLGGEDPPVTESIPLPVSGTERAVLHWVLDLNQRGFLPGDTALFKVRALDNAPIPQVGESQVFVLRLPSMSELRRAMREASGEVSATTDSLVNEQAELAKSLQDLAAERERGAAQTTGERRGRARAPDQLPFSSVERAQQLADREQQLLERAQQLRDEVGELSEAAWAAGLTDPEFHQQLRDLQELLERALNEEILERLEALRDALERLDASSVRDALRELAEAAEELREELHRGRELFERAAIEGEMTSLAAEAEELAEQQRAWNNAVEEGVDSALAAMEKLLAAQADSLAAEIAALDEAVDSSGAPVGGELDETGERARQAAGQMREAARQAQRGNSRGAQQSGEMASENLDPLGENLREQRDQMREAWRQEVLDILDRALVEGVELAKRQEEVASRLNAGESGSGVRGAQAAVREGVDRLVERLQSAAGKNALVSPRLGAALGFAKVRMNDALNQMLRPNPSTREAGEQAGQALDAMNAVIHAMLQSRENVAGAQSGSGLQEAVEQMAQLAEQQGQLNGETGGLLSMTPTAGDQLMNELRALAERQRALADELERLRGTDEVSGADALAEEAEEIARQLEAGRLGRDVIERQERLFRRLLDAGRTLQSDDEDERQGRVSEAADPTNVQLPPATGTLSGELRFPYPTWEQLRSLSPEQRRLILDYFRRLNERRP